MLIITSDTDRDPRAEALVHDWPGLLVEVAIGPDEIAARQHDRPDDHVLVECPVPEDDAVDLFCDTITRIQRLRRDDPGPLAFVPAGVPAMAADCARSDDPWEVCHALDDEGQLAFLHLGSAVLRGRLLPDFCSVMRDQPVSARSFVSLLEATQAWP